MWIMKIIRLYYVLSFLFIPIYDSQIYAADNGELTFCGRIIEKNKKKSVNDVVINIVMYNEQGQKLKGSTITDSTGIFIFYLPKCYGEWKVILETLKGKRRKEYILELAKQNLLPKKEIKGGEKEEISEKSKESQKLLLPEEIYQNEIVLPEVEIKKKQKLKYENLVKKEATIRYDVLKEAYDISNQGKDIPIFFEWLRNKNNSFEIYNYDAFYDTLSVNEEIRRSTANYQKKMRRGMTMHANKAEEMSWRDPAFYDKDMYFRSPFNGEITYKGRPVVWVLDEELYMISHANISSWEEEITYCSAISRFSFPVMMYNVDHMYICENSHISRNYVWSPRISQPVTVFIYSNRKGFAHEKGIYHCRFRGYSH